MSDKERARLIERILDIDMHTEDALEPPVAEQWFTMDLTMPQLRVLFLLRRRGVQTMGQIAKPMGVKLSTVTGIVDRLVERQLVSRGEDPHDRRFVVARLTDEGQRVVDSLYRAGRIRIAGILHRLTVADLRTVVQALDILRAAVTAEQKCAQKRLSSKQGVLDEDMAK